MSEVEEVTIENPKAVLAALDRAKEDAKKFREQYEQLVSETEAVRAELTAIQTERKNVLIERAVQDAGADPKRVMQFIKLDGIEYKDGKLEGFEEAFGTVKTALPELFDAKRRVGGKVEGEINGNPNHVKNTSEIQAERLLGNMARGR